MATTFCSSQPMIRWLASDLVLDGKPVEQCPRVVLQRQLQVAEALGFGFEVGVEAEFFLLELSGKAISDSKDTQPKPCYDQQSLMRRSEIIIKICNYMLELGWEPYQNDHEDANGQFEMNWKFSDSLTTADRHVFFKFMVKTIAEEHGYRATFMPRPFANLTGNGAHVHVNLYDLNAKVNAFVNKEDGLGISQIAYHFIGGVLNNAKGFCSLLAPTINSYKRLNGATTASGATWSPNAISYSGNNRTHMIRVPGPGRFELRLADGAVNPYLLPAAVLAVGLDGVRNKRDPGKPMTINMYTAPESVRSTVPSLPTNLLDALRELEANELLCSSLGSEFIGSYLKIKRTEWNEFMGTLHDWERTHTLDC